MRFRIIVLAIVAAALSVSVATAAPANDKPGKPDKPAAACKPRKVELKGLLTATSASSLTMTVKHANHHGQAFKKAGSATVNVDDMTRMKRDGKAAKLADLVAGDRLDVQASACRADLKDGATPALLARKVHARSAKAEEPKS